VRPAEETTAQKTDALQRQTRPSEGGHEEKDECLLKGDVEELRDEVPKVEREEKHVGVLSNKARRRREKKRKAHIDDDA
jgi:hypothetical protein